MPTIKMDIIDLMIVSLEGRIAAARSFTLNRDMQIEAQLCAGQISALKKEREKLSKRQINRSNGYEDWD